MAPEHERHQSALDEVLDSARSVEDAIQRLCRATLTRPSLAPADVDVVLAHLATVAGALPQAVSQLGDILEQTPRHHVLEMDSLAKTRDPDLAIDTVRAHLHTVRELALDLYHHLDAAHTQTAHIAVIDHGDDFGVGMTRDVTRPTLRPEERQPPPMGGCDADRGPAR